MGGKHPSATGLKSDYNPEKTCAGTMKGTYDLHMPLTCMPIENGPERVREESTSPETGPPLPTSSEDYARVGAAQHLDKSTKPCRQLESETNQLHQPVNYSVTHWVPPQEGRSSYRNPRRHNSGRVMTPPAGHGYNPGRSFNHRIGTQTLLNLAPAQGDFNIHIHRAHVNLQTAIHRPNRYVHAPPQPRTHRLRHWLEILIRYLQQARRQVSLRRGAFDPTRDVSSIATTVSTGEPGLNHANFQGHENAETRQRDIGELSMFEMDEEISLAEGDKHLLGF